MYLIDRLAEKFKKFPGIGPRQARRFVYFLLARPNGFLEELGNLLSELKNEIKQCEECQRYFAKNKQSGSSCDLCQDESRDRETLLVVSRDVDLENVEKSRDYHGQYFVLGGTVPVLEKEPTKRVRITKLKNRLTKNKIKEVILAMSANPEGENTADYIREAITSLAEKSDFKISTLGRGLSTGTELEYSDSETIKNALKNRG